MGFRIRNWGQFQHYKNRRPPWIRLYRDLLDDPDFNELDGELVKTLVKLWLAVSDFSVDGTFPDIKRLALRMHVDSAMLAKQLIQLNHWVECDDSAMLADCTQHAIPEGEQRESRSETEGEQREPRTPARPKPKRKRSIPEDWAPTDAHRDLAASLYLSVESEAEKFRDHAAAQRRLQADWDASFRNWLRKAAEYRQSSGGMQTGTTDKTGRPHIPPKPYEPPTLELPENDDPEAVKEALRKQPWYRPAGDGDSDSEKERDAE